MSDRCIGSLGEVKPGEEGALQKFVATLSLISILVLITHERFSNVATDLIQAVYGSSK